LKALAQPLTSEGRMWFSAPDQFRWELGSPAQTIAVRQPDQMLLLYPRLKRAERYPLSGGGAGQWREMLSLLEAGFPRNEQELKSRFNIIAHEQKNDLHEITLQPKSPQARRWMPRMKVAFSETDYLVRATELHFADGSTLRNDFANIQKNAEIDAALFDPEIPPDYKTAEPGKKR
jgi:outer membrane lipoprotein-sorting protein